MKLILTHHDDDDDDVDKKCHSNEMRRDECM